MAGRRPTPTQAKVLAGTFRKDRANAREPKPRTGKMREPDWLIGQARWAWRQLTDLLGEDGMRVLAKSDRTALALLCDCWREYREARAQVEREGLMFLSEDDNGVKRMRRHPLIGVYQDAWRRLRLMLVEFGLTPAARSKVHAADEADDDQLTKLLARRTSSQ